MKRKLRSRVVGAIAAGAVALLAVSGCTASDNGSGSAGQTITVAVVNNVQMLQMESLTKDFTKKTGINVKYVTLPDPELRQKVTTAAATKSGVFDIAMISPVEIQSDYAKNKWIVPLNPLFDKLSSAERKSYDLGDLLPSVSDSLTVDKQLYALPFYGESAITYYRTDLFQKAGITLPEKPTWDDITAAAAKLNDPANGLYGIVLKGIPQGGQLAPFIQTVHSYGAAFFDDNWEPQFTSAKFKKAANSYIDLIHKYGEPGAASVGYDEGFNLMAQGQAAIWIDSTVAGGPLADPKNSKVVGKVGYAQAPTEGCVNGSHWLYAWALSIIAGTKHQDAAFQFMRWATDKDYIGLVAKTSGWENVPPGTRTSTYENQSFLKVAPFAKMTLEAMDSATNNKPSCQSVPYRGTTAVYIPEWSDISTNLAQGLSAAAAGTETVDDWLSQSQAYAEKTMKDAGYIK